MDGESGRAPGVRLEPWGEGDLDLLRRLNAPEMTEFLGGPESEEKVRDRLQRYASLDGSAGRMYKIIAEPDGEPAGSIGYWDKEWRGETVYETGWGVLPEFRGRGLAVAATAALVDELRADAGHRYVHAFPRTDHAASNAICRRAGFTLLGEIDFEYPPGNPIRCNDWRYDLGTTP